jgi:hypothetical protein
MRKIIAFIKDLPRQWRADTPKVAKWVRNASATIAAVVPGAWLTFQGMGISLPEWFVNHVGYITLAALLITGVAGTKERSKK